MAPRGTWLRAVARRPAALRAARLSRCGRVGARLREIGQRLEVHIVAAPAAVQRGHEHHALAQQHGQPQWPVAEARGVAQKRQLDEVRVRGPSVPSSPIAQQAHQAAAVEPVAHRQRRVAAADGDDVEVKVRRDRTQRRRGSCVRCRGTSPSPRATPAGRRPPRAALRSCPGARPAAARRASARSSSSISGVPVGVQLELVQVAAREVHAVEHRGGKAEDVAIDDRSGAPAARARARGSACCGARLPRANSTKYSVIGCSTQRATRRPNVTAMKRHHTQRQAAAALVFAPRRLRVRAALNGASRRCAPRRGRGAHAHAGRLMAPRPLRCRPVARAPPASLPRCTAEARCRCGCASSRMRSVSPGAHRRQELDLLHLQRGAQPSAQRGLLFELAAAPAPAGRRRAAPARRESGRRRRADRPRCDASILSTAVAPSSHQSDLRADRPAPACAARTRAAPAR